MSRLEPELSRHLILQLLDVGREELDHLAAVRADHMVVMFVVVMMLVVSLVVAKPDLSGQPSLGQELKRPIDRGQTDCGVFPVHESVQILAREVFLSAQEYLENKVALAGAPEPGSLYMFLKYLSFDRKFICSFTQNACLYASG